MPWCVAFIAYFGVGWLVLLLWKEGGADLGGVER